MCLFALTALTALNASTALARNPSATAAPPTCSWELVWQHFQSVCKDPESNSLDLRKSADEADGVLFNFFLVHKKGRYEQIKAFDQTTTELSTKALKISEDVRKRAIRVVTAAAPENTWTLEERALATRIKTVSIRVADSTDPSCYALSDPGIPNAQYTQETHAITICPSLTRVHSELIAKGIAHELGHVISPCAMSRSLYQVAQETDTAAAINCLSPNSTDSDGTNDTTGTVLRSARQAIEAGFAVIDSSLNSESSELVRCGILQPMTAGKAMSPSSQEQFVKCALREHQPAYSAWLAQSKLGLEKMPRGLSKTQQKVIDGAKAETPALCFSKTDETYADSFAGQILARAVEESHLSAKDIGRYAYDFSAVACRNSDEPGYDFNTTNYPSAAERVRLLIETDSTMRKLGCEKDKRPLCAIEAGAFSRGNAHPSSSGTIPTNLNRPSR